MLKMTLIGNLGRDAEIREVNGQRVINFSVAHSEKYKDKATGKPVERTTWVRCSYWRDADKTAVAQYLDKGKKVYVEGIPSVSSYTTKEGELRLSQDLRVTSLELLSAAGDNNQSGESGQQAQGNAAQPKPEDWKTQKPPKSPPADPDAPSAQQLEQNTPLGEDDLPF